MNQPTKPLLLAVDFDDTIARNDCWPAVGEEVPGAVAALKELHAEGHRIQIWTCRHGEPLEAAKRWLDERGVTYERINENCPALIEQYGETRKMSADVYIDDKMLGGLPPWPFIVNKVRRHSADLRHREKDTMLRKMPKLIGLSGKRGSGKNTVATIMQEISWLYREFAFAGKLKLFAKDLTGLDDVYSQEGKAVFLPEWGMTVGELLQRLGTDAIRDNLHENAWVLACFASIQPDDYAIITDCRFPNEVEAIKARGGVVIRVEGDPLNQRGDGTRNDQHPSETALDDYQGFDYNLHNTGTLDDLRQQVQDVLAALSQPNSSHV